MFTRGYHLSWSNGYTHFQVTSVLHPQVVDLMVYNHHELYRYVSQTLHNRRYVHQLRQLWVMLTNFENFLDLVIYNYNQWFSKLIPIPHFVPPSIWVNFITTSLFSLTIIIVSRGNDPQMAQQFRLVKYELIYPDLWNHGFWGASLKFSDNPIFCGDRTQLNGWFLPGSMGMLWGLGPLSDAPSLWFLASRVGWFRRTSWERWRSENRDQIHHPKIKMMFV